MPVRDLVAGRSETRSFDDAVELALDTAMTADERVIVFGEDVRVLRRNLLARHGPDRVLDTPISEGAFVGAAVGAALAGLRPVVELIMVDFAAVAFDALVNHAAKFSAFSGGRWEVPMVVRAPYGGGGQHEQALWGLFAAIPGLNVVVPSTPADAAGLLLSAIEHDGPVMFMEPKLFTDTVLDYLGGTTRDSIHLDIPEAGHRGPVADPPTPVPIGRAAVRRHGDDILLVSLGVGVHRSLAAAEVLAADGIDAGVLDLRTVAPLDHVALLDLAEATRRVVVVDEDYLHGGLSGAISSLLLEEGVPIAFARVATESTIPFARALERDVLPNVDRIVTAARWLATASPG